MAEELHTGNDWADILGARILDHDGWRGSNPYGPCDFQTDLITKEDFDRRYNLCTVYRGPDGGYDPR